MRLLGYDGGTTPVYAYLRGIKQAANKRATERYETGPGEQAQFDWSFYTVMLGDVLTKVVVFGLILGYSRRKFYWPSLDATQPSIYEALEAGLRYFGGAPLRLLVDNDRSWRPRPTPPASPGTAIFWNCAVTTALSRWRASRAGRRRRARSSGPSSTSKSTSSRATPGRTSTLSAVRWPCS